jgi:hypothetical protein
MKLCNVLGLALLSLAIAGCGSSSGGDDTAAADAAQAGGPDSALQPADANPAQPDAEVIAPADASTTDPRVGMVKCGDAECDLTGGNVCCVSMSGSSCTAEASCTGGFSAPQHCDGPEDCTGGKRCCAYAPILTDTPGAFCEDTCSTAENGATSDLCHDEEQCPGTGQSCGDCCFPGAGDPTNSCLSDSVEYQYCPCA